jgi:hypothetical protein
LQAAVAVDHSMVAVAAAVDFALQLLQQAVADH